MKKVNTNRMSYIKEGINNIGQYKLAVLFLFTAFVLPQYFGLDTPGFDLTALRIMIILGLLFIASNKEYFDELINIVKKSKVTYFIAFFMAICIITCVCQKDVGSIMNPFLEFLTMFMLVFFIRKIIGIAKTIDWIVVFLYIFTIQGIIEYIRGETLFAYLETIKGLYTGAFIRSGSYRIMGPANHSLAYGLILVSMFPIICIDYSKNEINLLKNKLLLALMTANVFLTGSRSTLALFFLEIFFIFILSSGINKKRIIIILSIIVGIIAALVIVLRGSTFSNYIMLQLTSVIDTVCGTEYAVQYGADLMKLQSSSDYRDRLTRVFTEAKFLSPVIGKGTKYAFFCYIDGYAVESIDNYYVATYIRYAYPGLITFLLVVVPMIARMVVCSIKNNSALGKCLFTGCICYFINLWWMDSLQTLKYAYILFAIFMVEFKEENTVNNDGKKKINEKTSKYIKRKKRLIREKV